MHHRDTEITEVGTEKDRFSAFSQCLSLGVLCVSVVSLVDSGARLSAQVPSAVTAPAPAAPIRAQYGWGYAGAEGEGVGTLSLLLEPRSGKLIAELHGLGERLVLVEGDRAAGYRVQVPRQKLDRRAASLADLPLPFLPQVASVEALLKLLRTGEAPGVSVLKKDAQGPIKLHWRGKDPKGREEQVWLERKRWEEGR